MPSWKLPCQQYHAPWLLLTLAAFAFAGCVERDPVFLPDGAPLDLPWLEDAPERDLSAPDLPATDLPAADLPPADLPAGRDAGVDGDQRIDDSSPPPDAQRDTTNDTDVSVDSTADLATADTSPPVDTAPPVLVEGSVAPPQVDVTNASADVMVTLKVTDESDLKYVTATFALSTTSSKTFVAAFYERDYNSALGAYQKAISIPHGQEPGTYRMIQGLFQDALDNRVIANTTNPTIAGFDIRQIEFVVVNAGPVDTSPPVLVEGSVAPQQVDVTSASADVMVALNVTDENDLKYVTATFALTTNSSKLFVAGFYERDYNSVTGAYEKAITIPQGQEPGTYRMIQGLFQDALDNRVIANTTNPTLAGFDIRNIAFDVVTTAPVDTSPPVLVEGSVAPQQVDVTHASADVMVSLKVTDESELKYVTATFALTTNSSKTFVAAFYEGDYNSVTGAYEKAITIPHGQEPGMYQMIQGLFQDVLGNRVIANTANPTIAGFDISTISFVVVNNP